MIYRALVFYGNIMFNGGCIGEKREDFQHASNNLIRHCKYNRYYRLYSYIPYLRTSFLNEKFIHNTYQLRHTYSEK